MTVVEDVVWNQIVNNSDNSGSSDLFYERKWEWTYLRTAHENLYLEPLYKTYVQRLQRSYLSIFLVLHTAIAIIHTVFLLVYQLDDSPIAVEVFAYLVSIFLIWAILFITFRDEMSRKHPWIPYVTSSLTVFTLIIVDIIAPLVHSPNTLPIRPTYAAHIVLVVYIFLPLSDNRHACILGLASTTCYLIIFGMVTYRGGLPNSEQRTDNIVMESIFLISVNFFGIYYRLINEIVIRRTFLDRRQCVESSLMLKYARDQERNLLLSILPKHTADALEKDISEMIKKIKSVQRTIPSIPVNLQSRLSQHVKNWGGQAIKKTYVELHSNVSVLYADIVNYTSMTSSLEVKPLVETLHELFVKFDQASEENDVLRIKFLGDCYCCVSGVPKETPKHAQNCVELGLKMIKIIQNVRKKKALDIDMRIGIHSGSIIAGVIGALKWQYDIWSKDVAIANKMESTGIPGMLHVTEQTLDLLKGNYDYTEGTEKGKQEPLLIANHIKTYLIRPDDSEKQNHINLGSRLRISAAYSRNSEVPSSKTNFMRNSMEQYQQIMRQINEEMKREMDLMPIGKFHFNKLFAGKNVRRITEIERDNTHLKRLSMVFLCFKDKEFELSFLNEPDFMLKYSITMCFIVFILIATVQIISKPLSADSWYLVSFCGIMLLVLLALSWYRKLWIMSTPVDIEDSKKADAPVTFPWNSLFQISYYISNGAIIRTIIYVILILLLSITSLLHLLELERMAESELGIVEDLPINSWLITQCLICVLCVNFLFLRIHFIIKLIVGIIINGTYTLLILDDPFLIFEKSYSINPALKPMVAHLMAIWITLITFHLIDRQTEYISRIDYSWKQQLLKRQEEAEITKETNNILVCNILPSHVAEIYINLKLSDELYYEKYDKNLVSVMFATVTDFDINIEALNILNQIICDFDEALLTYPRLLKIEKIKVAGWTYMAACGLDPGRGGDSTNSANMVPEISIRSSTGRREYIFTAAQNQKENRSLKMSNSVYVLTEFALQLMGKIQEFNEENFNSTFKLRVGISNGVVMAGVVGSSKPLYDIWGDAVNMASRMDSTGEPGKIQVTKTTAAVLQSYGIECEYRGVRFIKGAGNMETFFVPFDDNFSFLPLVTSTAL